MLHFNGPAEEAAVENGQGIGWAGRRRPFEDCVLVLPPSPLTTWLHFSQHKIYIYVRLQSEKQNKKTSRHTVPQSRTLTHLFICSETRKLYKIDFPTRTMDDRADNEAPLKRNQINLSTTITINYKRPRRLLCTNNIHTLVQLTKALEFPK